MAKNKYGFIWGQENAWFKEHCKFMASVTLKEKSGRYCTYDISDGGFSLTANGVAVVGGYCNITTADVTTTGDFWPLAINPWMFACELPYAVSGAAGTLTEVILNSPTAGLATAIISKTIDIYVTADIQYADDQGNDNILHVVGGDVGENTLYVVVKQTAMDQLA